MLFCFNRIPLAMHPLVRPTSKIRQNTEVDIRSSWFPSSFYFLSHHEWFNYRQIDNVNQFDLIRDHCLILFTVYYSIACQPMWWMALIHRSGRTQCVCVQAWSAGIFINTIVNCWFIIHLMTAAHLARPGVRVPHMMRVCVCVWPTSVQSIPFDYIRLRQVGLAPRTSAFSITSLSLIRCFFFFFHSRSLFFCSVRSYYSWSDEWGVCDFIVYVYEHIWIGTRAEQEPVSLPNRSSQNNAGIYRDASETNWPDTLRINYQSVCGSLRSVRRGVFLSI